jgi:uncharacterized membrane protein YccC
MPKVQVNSQIEIDFADMLQGVARLENNELEQFADQVIALRAQRRASSLPQHEAELLQRINHGISTEMRMRLRQLSDKVLEEIATDDEQDELIQLSNRIEEADAQRLRDLTLLANIRKVSLDELMKQLDIC